MAAKKNSKKSSASVNKEASIAKLQLRIVELEQENSKLSSTVNSDKPAPVNKSGGGFKKFGVIFFVTLSIVAFMLFNVSSWVKNTVLDTDTFVATLEPLIEQPEVQDAIQVEISNQLFENVDVEESLEEVLPEQTKFLAGPLSGQIESFANSQIKNILSSEQAKAVWVATLQTVHATMLAYISDENTDGTISVNDLYQYASEQLGDSSISFLLNKSLPSAVGEITLAELKWVPEAKTYVNAVDKLPIIFGLVGIVSLALALLLAASRRKVLIVFLVLSLIMTASTLATLAMTSAQIGSQVDPQYSAAATAVHDVITNPLVLRTQGYFALLTAMLVVIIVSSKAAFMVKTRQFSSKYINIAMDRVVPEYTTPSWASAIVDNKAAILWTTFIALALLLGVRIPPSESQVISGFTNSAIITLVIYLAITVLQHGKGSEKSN